MLLFTPFIHVKGSEIDTVFFRLHLYPRNYLVHGGCQYIHKSDYSPAGYLAKKTTFRMYVTYRVSNKLFG